MAATSPAMRSGKRAHPRVVPVKAALGAEIRGVDMTQVDEPAFNVIHEAWLNHVLLIFRGQSLAAENLVGLVRRFGTPVSSSNPHQRRSQLFKF